MSLAPYTFREEVKRELLNILSYWLQHSIEINGNGFYGAVNAENVPDEKAPKAIVITGRILWTFSAAHQLFPNDKYPVIAKRAFEYLKTYFIDKQYGGVYWSVTAGGSPLQSKKQMYGHSFAIYGLSEYYKITQDPAVLDLAKGIFSKIIRYSFDEANGGYTEAFERDWTDTDDYILSLAPNSKSMNTHLHLLEAFTNLHRVWKSESSAFHLEHSIEIMLGRIINPGTNSMTLFFTKDWQPQTNIISYGHDIESSWLICEAAEVLGNETFIKKCKEVAAKMATAAAAGLAEDGAINYEIDKDSGHLNDSKQWWPQAEAMIGFYNAYQLTGKVHFLEKSEKVWAFIKEYLIDHKNGEWCGAIDASHKVRSCDKITFWKGPYHNSRSCMELWRRLEKDE